MIEVILGVGFFTGIVLFLVGLILLAKSRLVPSGPITITINDDPDKAVTISAGGKLLNALSDQGIFVSSACGGGGTCAQCKVIVSAGGGEILPTERSHITAKEALLGERLSCQVACKQDMKIELPAEVFDTQKWRCRVKSNKNVATFIKELILELPAGENVKFRAGGYIQIEAPPYEMTYKDINVEQEYRDEWDKHNLWQLCSCGAIFFLCPYCPCQAVLGRARPF